MMTQKLRSTEQSLDKSTGKQQRVLILVRCIALARQMLIADVQFTFKPFNKNTTKTIHIDTVTTKD